MTWPDLANQVRELRGGLRCLGVSRAAAAAHLGVRPQTLSQYSLAPDTAGARPIPEARLRALEALHDERKQAFINEIRGTPQ